MDLVGPGFLERIHSGLAGGAAQAQNLPGKGITVQPLQSSIAEETFQTLLVSRAMEKLGLSSRVALLRYALQQGWLDLS